MFRGYLHYDGTKLSKMLFWMSIVCVFADAKVISSKQSLLVSQWPVKVTLHLVQNLYHMEHPQMECCETSAVTESSVTFNHKTRVV